MTRRPSALLLCAAAALVSPRAACFTAVRLPAVGKNAPDIRTPPLRESSSFEEPNGANGGDSAEASAAAPSPADAGGGGGGPPPDLVPKDVFIAALETLHGSPPGSEAEDDDTFYAIGKLMTSLTVAPPSPEGPGLDLAESTGLVLVSGATGPAADAGIQVGDTITAVCAGGGDDSFRAETRGLNLDETVQIVVAAMGHVAEHGRTEIDLELNRLIKCGYQ